MRSTSLHVNICCLEWSAALQSGAHAAPSMACSLDSSSSYPPTPLQSCSGDDCCIASTARESSCVAAGPLEAFLPMKRLGPGDDRNCAAAAARTPPAAAARSAFFCCLRKLFTCSDNRCVDGKLLCVRRGARRGTRATGRSRQSTKIGRRGSNIDTGARIAWAHL